MMIWSQTAAASVDKTQPCMYVSERTSALSVKIDNCFVYEVPSIG